MEDVLKRLIKHEEKAKRNEAIKLLKTYINNVVDNPSNAKFRRIRINNLKFHSVIWSIEEARSFLLLAGFEENDGFLVLPDDICLDGPKIILENVSLDDDSSSSQPSTSTSHQETTPPSPSKLLKLRDTPADRSIFDEVATADMTLLSYMKEMGFDVAVAEKALILTKNQGIQPAMDWINSNPAKVNEIKLMAFKKTNIVPEAETQHKPPVPDGTHTIGQAAPVSRFQATIDERHRFQERVRLEAIEAARVERATQKRQKEYLLKNLEDEKRERREKDEWAKCARTGDVMTSHTAPNQSSRHEFSISPEKGQPGIISLKLRLPDGQVSTLSLQSKSKLNQIFKHVSEISSLQDGDFTLMLISPQRKLTDKDKSLEELGLQSHETLIVQRSGQSESLTQGQGEFYKVLDAETVHQLQTLLWKNSNVLNVVQFYSMNSDDNEQLVKEIEDLSARYGSHRKVIFIRVNTDLLPALKEDYDIDISPTYKLIWNREIMCDVEGKDKETLEGLIKDHIGGPVTMKVGDNTSTDYFDPR